MVHPACQSPHPHYDTYDAILTCHSHPDNVVIKSASQVLLHNQTKHLTALRGNESIRQMVETIESPPFIVPEYAEEDLRSLSIRRKLERAEIKTIARQILEALAFAHARNIVQPDIKPQNIMLSGFTPEFKCSKASVN
ncbi:hypothetical protein ONS96_011587 [Cadophora gregata f. sp. sojae]|nr:hypothetical protein ONS96_011587 [Cadophora gregata f. sp. sojae]